MFSTHQPLIAQHARTPEGLADVVQFVICTINQHFFRVGGMIERITAEGLEHEDKLTASQQRGIAFIREHAAQVLDDLHTCTWEGKALRRLVELPSLGLVKAGFICQLIHGTVGCLDRHNLVAAGLSATAFKKVPTNAESLTVKIETYLAACAALGTPAQLWDGWCTLIAAKYPTEFKDAEDVSWKHVLWCQAD